MPFNNRIDAGKQLALKVERYLSSMPASERAAGILVVALPRGGAPVALEVARKLRCPLEIIVAKKLPFPSQPEYAIGAVSSDGIVFLSPDIPKERAWENYIEEQRNQLLTLTKGRENQFYELSGCCPSSFNDKVVIVVDDGVATGMTALAAVETARERGARRTIMAAPVMSTESYRELKLHCDEVIAVEVPTVFNAVGQHYLDFDQTSSDEVVKAMRMASQFSSSIAC